jgi:tRNA(fMet)-specific endonuclease VapC
MSYLLDTNAAIALLKNHPTPVRERLRRALATEVRVDISSVVLFELAYGVARSTHREQNAERLRVFLSGQIGVISFGSGAAHRAGTLRAALEQAGTPIGPYDLLLAAQALEAHSTLVTANVGEFARVEGLRWEDWSRPN